MGVKSWQSFREKYRCACGEPRARATNRTRRLAAENGFELGKHPLACARGSDSIRGRSGLRMGEERNLVAVNQQDQTGANEHDHRQREQLAVVTHGGQRDTQLRQVGHDGAADHAKR